MNSVNLVGRLTRDPEVRYTEGGTSIARLTIACDRRFKKAGDSQTADFISCIAFGKTAEFIEKYFKQGMKIGADGKIQTGSYTNKDGQKVYTTDVVVENVEFVESKSSGGGQAQESEGGWTPSDGFMNIPDGIDEELPFN
ncbi:MAG: single-stranded DNA-binding protein [Herbinix sp.]|jgi:single-strand DNA-binding protein|nr:single-stranded DNA-binding protein [Herbinix sp.]